LFVQVAGYVSAYFELSVINFQNTTSRKKVHLAEKTLLRAEDVMVFDMADYWAAKHEHSCDTKQLGPSPTDRSQTQGM